MNFHKPIKKLTTLGVIIAAAALLWLALSAGDDATTALAQTGDTPTPEATAQPGDIGDQQLPSIEGKLNPPQYPNMDSNLNQIVEQAQSGQSSARDAAANAPIHEGESVAVTLYITEGYADAISDWLTDNGASPRNIGADYIEAYVPVSLLGEASEQEGVISIQTIIPPQPAQGVVVSEGVAVHGVPAWHAAGLKGQGIRIGIIDDGFQGFQTLMGTELPASVEARCYTDIGVYTQNLADCTSYEGVHGKAVTETIFDIAPEATYYIADPYTPGDLQSAVNWMVEHDVDVINMSLGWTWEGPGDGTTPHSDGTLRTVDTAVAGGVTWVNAAGNSATETWFGPFTDTDSDNWHNFSGDDEMNCADITAEEGILAQLRWDDTWGGASRDLDLVLIPLGGGDSDIVASSNDEQSGGAAHMPREILEYTPVTDGTYCLAVNHFEGAAPSWVQIQAWNVVSDLDYYTPSGSIANPAESANPGLLAVGAAPWYDTHTITWYSSQGPTTDGRIKPDIVGATDGQSVSYRTADNPTGAWGGTSNASPHVAGLAALVKQNYPSYTPQQVAQYMKTHAEQRGAVPNNTWGYGFARLLASDVVPPSPSPSPTASPTPSPSPTPSEDCVDAIEDNDVVQGSWTSDCESTSRSGNYALYYTFTLTEASEVTITLESDVDTYLYLLQGTGMDSATPYCENDDYGTLLGGRCYLIQSDLDTYTDSGIAVNLAAGDYTIEATTYYLATEGDFTLTMTIGDSTTPPPTPVPTPSPTPGDIEDAACTEDDLAELSDDFTLDDTDGPYSYDDSPGYWGITGGYFTYWTNADGSAEVICYAMQYDSIHNARWSELNYPGVLQWMGGGLWDVRSHEQVFIPYIGDDMLAYRVHYHDEGDINTMASVNFLNAVTRTVTVVGYFTYDTDTLPDIGEPESVANLIADRVMPSDETAAQAQGIRSIFGLFDPFD